MGSRSEILTELLVLRIQSGERKAFDLLVAQWHRRLIRRVFRLTQDPDAAKDIAQETWIAVVKGIRRLDDPSRFQNWIYRIIRNKCADWIRKEQSERRLKVTFAEEAESRTESKSDGPIDVIRSEIRKLPNDQRTVLTLFYLNEMGVRAIALNLGIPEGTVKSRLYHAREMLKEMMEVES